MIRHLRTCAALLPFTLIVACSEPERMHAFEGFAQGTTYHVSFRAAEPVDLPALRRAVDDELGRIDKAMSGYRQDSAIEQFNAARDLTPHTTGREIVTLVQQARSVSQASEGCYDLSIKPLFDLWGFGDDRFSPPSAGAIGQTLASTGMDKVESVGDDGLRKTRPDLQIDLSSIAQGYSVGRVARVLEQRGIRDYLVEIGGELQTRGGKPDGQPWRVAIERPVPGERKVEKVITIATADPLAVMTSGTYRHYFDADGKRYSHILDARTGRPVEHATVSVTVLYPEPAAADAWSTALLCLGREQGLKVANEQGIPALFIDQNGDRLTEAYSRALQSLGSVHIE
ncbi:FAD:protein FMN transferase [Marinobacterium sp. D7]|uniref:FAD:protein FMN transferase n=1 Tax=Marinobacterium ramblicola TaxID=2849041 RepID=UPI001C2DE317|nr:FAD:protein FMN transferase [Marinobacterium ramblicola]MBV1788434.1 FAD:protein FMN transferase [Marinobacterium ramblicola]